MFQANTADLDYLFNTEGQTVLINDIERQAIITNPSISEYDQKYIHTLETVYMGDMVTLDNDKYLVITETVSKRGAKYKALMRHCNFIIKIENYEEVQTGETPFGDPIYENVLISTDYIPAIVDNKTFSIDTMSAIRVADNQIVVVIQDNELNLVKFAVNQTFNVMDKSWKVLNHDKTKKGLLILTCEVASST